MEEVFVDWEPAVGGTAIFFQRLKIPTGTCSKRICLAAAGARPATPRRQKARKLQKRKGFFSHLLLQFKWRVNRKQARIPEEVFRHVHCMHFCQEGSILKDSLCYWHMYNINVLSFFSFPPKQNVFTGWPMKAQQLLTSVSGADRIIKAY